MLKAIHALDKARKVAEKLEALKLSKATKVATEETEETTRYYKFPPEHWRCIRTNNPMERINRKIRRSTSVVGSFPDGKSALMLAAARLRHIALTKWGTRPYLNMSRLYEREKEEVRVSRRQVKGYPFEVPLPSSYINVRKILDTTFYSSRAIHKISYTISINIHFLIKNSGLENLISKPPSSRVHAAVL